MVLRRAFFRWLLPAALVLPLWQIVGWAIFGRSGWALLWVLLVAVPSILVGQLLLTLLTRTRPSVRAERALSWPDVAGFGIWHALIIAVGCFIDGAFPWLLTGAILAGLGLFWLQARQLWVEARGSGARIRETLTWSAMTGGARPDPEPGVVVIEEHRLTD